MNIIDALSEQGMPPKNNEDIWGHIEKTAWIFDGATGLSKENLIAPDGQTDPRWLVEAAHASLFKHAVNRGDDLRGLYADVLKDCKTAFDLGKKREPSAPYELPMAASLVIHYNGTHVTCAALSDCAMIIETSSGLKVMEPCARHAEIDNTTKIKMVAAIESGLAPEKARDHLIPHLQNNRKLANCEGGYNVFAPLPGLENYLRIETFEPAKNGHALLMTDGFHALVENYGVYTNQTLIEAAKAQGLKTLYSELRAIEDKDSGLLKYPRFKKSDDATAALIKF